MIDFQLEKKCVAGPGTAETCKLSVWENGPTSLLTLLSPVSPAACTYRNQACCFTIHYESGFSITTEPQEGAFPKTIIQAPYEKLKMSSDDGIRMLYLDFGGKDGEIVSVFL